MKDDSRYFDVEDMFCNLFVLAGEYGIKKEIFTAAIEKHDFIISIEKGDYRRAYDYSVLDAFNESLSSCLKENNCEGKIDEYYWVGKCYFYIQNKTNKSFAYIFMKLPFENLLNMFNPYHEKDLGHILDYFYKTENDKTILSLLCKRRKISTAYLSNETGIAISTLTKYRKSDEFLYKASFANIYVLSQYFNCPETLFLEKVPQIK